MIVSQEKIEKEFTSSMFKAISKMAEYHRCSEDDIQIAMELSAKEETIYKVYKDFSHLRTVELKDILFVSPIFAMFKSTIADNIKKCLKKLCKQESSNFVTVFITKSKQPGKLRIMLYVKGSYKCEMTANQIASL